METSVIQVNGMSCAHCVKAVETAVGALPGVTAVTADLAAGTVTVEYEPAIAPLDKIKCEIDEQGYEVAS